MKLEGAGLKLSFQGAMCEVLFLVSLLFTGILKIFDVKFRFRSFRQQGAKLAVEC